MSQRIPDQILIGAVFGNEKEQKSVIISPYDYKYFISIRL